MDWNRHTFIQAKLTFWLPLFLVDFFWRPLGTPGNTHQKDNISWVPLFFFFPLSGQICLPIWEEYFAWFNALSLFLCPSGEHPVTLARIRPKAILSMKMFLIPCLTLEESRSFLWVHFCLLLPCVCTNIFKIKLLNFEIIVDSRTIVRNNTRFV